MKRPAAILFAFFVLFAAGCGPAEKITVIEADDPIFNGLTSVHTRAVVLNGAAKDLTVENAVLDFFYRERHLASARLMLPVTVHAGAAERVRIDLKLESESLSNLQTLQRRMETVPERLTVSVRAQVRYGKTRRTVEKKNIPYSAIIANFETPIQ